MSPRKHRLWCLVLLSSAVALAQGSKPVVMPFPLEFKRVAPGVSKEDKELLQREYQRLLRVAGAQLPDFVRADTALKELKRQDCEREDECLVQLAKRAEALYGLFVSVDFTLEGTVVAAGRVVRDDGRVVSPPQPVRLVKGKDTYKDVVRNALSQLFVQLKISELPATRPLEAKVEPPKAPEPAPAVVREPPPPPPPLVIDDAGAAQRGVGKTLLVAGAGVAAVGGIIAAVGGGVGGSAPTGSVDGARFAQTPSAAQQLRTASTLSAVGFAGLGVGAVTAAVGAFLWATSTPPPVSRVVFMPMPDGAVVQLGGSF